MTIDQAKQYIEAKARKNQVGSISINDFNLYFERSQIEKIEELWQPTDTQIINKVSRQGYSASSTISDKLSRLVVTTTLPVSTEGFVQLPSDYMYFVNLESKWYENPTDKGASPEINQWVQVSKVGHHQRDHRVNSELVGADAQYPVFLNYGTQFEVIGANNVRLTYIKIPNKPVWAFTEVNNAPVYDPANSNDWELPDSVHNDLVEKVLTYIGVSTRDNNLYQYGESEQIKTV